ncbi:unnamed protein product [Medioppia subpectinata]|uniref:Amino acid transporter n=1 Tax=Medioppia subpectinata TaxID=1979941 RepID=A0A7R9KU22_9ACAR|nr:unnamed protein product [Medioppia subpectinata]CAG2108679.1 unnamed protein product [Medioppia subpectinata]
MLRRNKYLLWFKVWCNENKYSLLIILAAIMGLTLGFIAKSIFTISPIALVYIALPGTLIIRAFTMIIVPFIVSSLSTSITATKRGENKRMIVLTFILVIVFTPGVRDVSAREASHRDVTAGQSSSPVGRDIKQMISSQDESIYDMFINLVPDNIIAAAFTTHYTALVPLDPQNLTLGYKKVAERAVKPNMLGLCVFALILGFVVLQLDSKAENIKNILYETNASNANRALTLPVTIKTMVDKYHLHPSVAQFVLPLGMNINMNGSAMYYPAVALFVAQMHNHTVTLQIIFTLIMSMAIPSAPASGGSLVNFISYCAVIGIDYPLDILAYTMTMDWLMDRMRTVTNVLGDCFISAIVQKLCHIKSDITDDYNLAQMLPTAASG